MEGEATITVTQRGGQKLCYQGFLYNKSKATKDGTSWRCELYPKNKCPGRIHTDVTGKVLDESFKEHSHIGDQTNVDVANLKAKVNEAATTSREATGQIINGLLPGLPQSSQSAAPLPSSLSRQIQRKRRANCPPEPTEMSEFKVLDKFQVTLGDDPVPFLLFDSMEEDGPCERRLILWSTKANLEFLAAATTIHMDGTFRTVPTLFYQLYVILAPVNSVAVPLVYGLCSHKDREMYELYLSVVLDKITDFGLHPKFTKITIDFEKAVAAAIGTVFPPEVLVAYCFFHLVQSLWKTLQRAGLQAEYTHNTRLREEFGQICAIAFVPIHEVVNAFTALFGSLSPEIQPVAQHLDHYYIRGRPIGVQRPRANAVQRRRPPLFRKEDWNCYDRIRNGESKTNNVIEGWNNRFKNLVGISHPSVYKFCAMIQQEQRYTEGKIRLISQGRIKQNVSQKTSRAQEALKTIAQDFDNRPILDYLRAASHNIQISDLVQNENTDDSADNDDFSEDDESVHTYGL